MFNTKYKKIPHEFEKNSGELKTERAGYIPAQKRIENLMLAGQRLVSSRKEMYDFPDGKIDEDYIDPTRKKDFDLADAFQGGLIANSNLKASQTALNERIEAENNKKVSEHTKAE